LATVITNLLSAIPIFGQDIVELKNVTEFFSSYPLRGEATITTLLPTIGTVSIHALKKGKKIRIDKKEYLSIPYQFLAFLAGFIDGDGYFQITKTTKGFITLKLRIVLQLEDLSTLEYIQSILKLGKLDTYRDYKNPICRLTINRTDLQEVIFPLFLHHGIFFLTEARRAQFDLAMFILKNDIKLFDKINFNTLPIPNLKQNFLMQDNKKILNIPTVFILPKTALDYVNLPFFKNWLVGFTAAEGSFLIKSNNDGCFQLKQKIHVQLFEAFKLIFNTNRKIFIEQNKFNQFSVSSKNDIQSVINFFSFSGFHPLIGLKCIQYLIWLSNLKNSKRYNNLKFPQ
jgi:LAGLIDADG endonuclease